MRHDVYNADRTDENISDNDLLISPHRVLARPKFHIHDSTDSSATSDVIPRVPSPISRALVSPGSCISLAAEIVSSPYSFTFTQNTGALLKTRLEAMHRSMNTRTPHNSHSPMAADLQSNELSSSAHLDDQINSLLKYLKSSAQGDLKWEDSNGVNIATLTLLVQPYMDSVPVVSKPSRPPTMFRRASSMIFGKSTDDSYHPRTPSRVDSLPFTYFKGDAPPSLPATPLLNIDSPKIGSIAKGTAHNWNPSANHTVSHNRGIATPLQHLPSKQAGPKAQFVTSTEYPYAIRTVNDVACVYLGVSQKDAQTRNFADFFPNQFRTWLRERIEQSKEQDVRLSGQSTEINSTLVSLWMEKSGADVFVWVTEKIQKADDSQAKPASPQPSPDHAIDHIFRLHSPLPTVILQGNGHLWTPPVIGCAVLVSPTTLEIIDYNQAVLSLLLGTDFSMRGQLFTMLVPQFLEFWKKIKELCVDAHGNLIPGIVIPEHKFRALAGIRLNSPAFISPYPCQEANSSIELVTDVGSLFIDLHLRVIENDSSSIWISYSHQSTCEKILGKEPRSDSGNLILNVVTPPATPLQSPKLKPLSPRYDEDYSDLMNIKVGDHRRDTKVESFEELKLLGKGGYGEVKLVSTPSKNHKLVLKSIYKDRILVDTWSRDRVLGTIPNEIRVLNQLRSSKHPHIVQMLDFFEDPRCYYIEMLPCRGPGVMDLFDFIEMQAASMSSRHMLCIWEQIVSAVAHLHSLGIVHRDLKDENVIMDSRGSATLIDFGGSAYINQGPFDVFVGTIDYAAPEIVVGELYDGIPQDNWALGIMLYTMIMREPPFRSADEIVAAQVPATTVNGDEKFTICENLIRKLLSKAPENRPNTSQILEMLDGQENVQ